MRLSRATRALWSTLWLVPLLCLAGGVVVALGTLAVDRRHDYRLVPHGLTGGPAVEAMLSTFATSMVSLTTLVLTLVAVQLAMGQFSSTPQVPRRLRAALEDLKTVAPPDRRPSLDPRPSGDGPGEVARSGDRVVGG
jgi:uncharacterized membrane protein